MNLRKQNSSQSLELAKPIQSKFFLEVKRNLFATYTALDRLLETAKLNDISTVWALDIACIPINYVQGSFVLARQRNDKKALISANDVIVAYKLLLAKHQSERQLGGYYDYCGVRINEGTYYSLMSLPDLYWSIYLSEYQFEIFEKYRTGNLLTEDEQDQFDILSKQRFYPFKGLFQKPASLWTESEKLKGYEDLHSREQFKRNG